MGIRHINGNTFHVSREFMMGWFYEFFFSKKKKLIEPTPPISVFCHAVKASVTGFGVRFLFFLEVSNYEKS